MDKEKFRALVVRQVDKKGVCAFEELTVDDLPKGDVLVKVDYSSLNYKDGMALTGTGKIVREFPMVPGIDLAGTVMESASSEYKPGDRVVLTGWSVGERYWGGYTQVARVRSEWLVPLPEGLDTKKAMAIGTAGFTGMLCVLTLEGAGITPDKGKILVTGASGGVGSVAVSVLAKLGYAVTALIPVGHEDAADYLKKLGAKDVIWGPEWSAPPRPLESQIWTGAVDTVGSIVLARVLAQMDYGGCVANCGLAGGADLPTTVMPFILRGVSLRGVDSVMCPIEKRKAAWKRLVKDLPPEALDTIHGTVPLSQAIDYAGKLMAGEIRGRMVVDVNR